MRDFKILRFPVVYKRKLTKLKNEFKKWLTYNSSDLKSLKQYSIALSALVIAILLIDNLEKFTVYKFLIFEPLERKTQNILLPIIIGLIFVSVKKFKVNISPINLSVLILLGFFEIIQDKYQYLSFKYIINIDLFGFYIITISLLFIKSIILHLRGFKLSENFNRTKHLNIIEIDGPVQNLKQNKFPEREEFVKDLYESIINFDLETSISIGIEGNYGSGKTSILNILKNDFLSNRADIELINFNPWQFDNLSGVKESYLEILNERLAIDNNLLIRYKKSLSNLENKILGISTLSELISVNSSNDIKNQIDRKISSHPIKRKFIVFIDDLDRLDSKEIINIFKLVRVIADFKNFIYVIPYDSDYLFKSLEKELKLENREEFEFYISKIINIQREVPTLSSVQLGEIFLELLMKSLIQIKHKNKELENIDNNSSDYKGIENQNIIFSIFSNYRDVKRFLNTFLQNYSTVSILIDFKDYFFVQLLKYFYRQEYDELKNTPYNELYNKYVKVTPEFKSHDCLKIIQELFLSSKSNSKSFYNEDMLRLYFLDGISDEIKINAQIKESLNSENKELKKIIKLWLLNINKVPNILYKIKRNENFKNYETVLKFVSTIKDVIEHKGYEEENVLKFLEKLLFQIEKNDITKLLNDLNSANQISLGLIQVNSIIIKTFAYHHDVGNLYETQLKLFQKLFDDDNKKEIGKKIYLIFKALKSLSNNVYKNYVDLWSRDVISISLIQNTSEILEYLKSKNSLFLLNKKESKEIEAKAERFFPSDFMEDFNIIFLSKEFVENHLPPPKEYTIFTNDIIKIYNAKDNEKLQVIDKLIKSYE